MEKGRNRIIKQFALSLKPGVEKINLAIPILGFDL